MGMLPEGSWVELTGARRALTGSLQDRLLGEHRQARESLGTAGQAMLDAEHGRRDPAAALAVAHGRVMHAALLLSLSPDPRAHHLAGGLFDACVHLLEAEALLDADADAPEPESPLPLEAFPVSRCAGIAAALDWDPEQRDDILARNELDADTWARLSRHWSQRETEEFERGRRDLLEQYDRAYVEAIERERGAITVGEVARLKVATGRGTQAAVLEELRLPAAAVMRVERMWLSRVTSDAELRERLRVAIADERSK